MKWNHRLPLFPLERWELARVGSSGEHTTPYPRGVGSQFLKKTFFMLRCRDATVSLSVHLWVGTSANSLVWLVWGCGKQGKAVSGLYTDSDSFTYLPNCAIVRPSGSLSHSFVWFWSIFRKMVVIILSKISQSQKGKYYMFTLPVESLKERKTRRQKEVLVENRKGAQERWGSTVCNVGDKYK